MASESGVLPVPEEKIARKWRLQPGKMLLIDLEEGRIIDDEEIKQKLAREHPYAEWLKQTQYKLEELPESEESRAPAAPERHRGFAAPASRPSATPRRTSSSSWSRWRRTATIRSARWAPTRRWRCLSDKPKLLFNYFKQNFAQVTNPPIDPIREELVMSLVSIIGPRPNLLGHHAGNYLRLEVAQPILTNTDLEKIRDIDNIAGGAFRTQTIDITWPASEGADGMEKAIFRICQAATEAVLADYTILILSDREAGENRIPIPSLLATAAVHNHLIRQGLRMSTGIVVETGEAREVHHFCVLAGYGAEAINPYLAFETLEQIRVQLKMNKSAAEVKKNYLKAVGKGIMKVMSKMGISTYQSYCGAQIFDAVGLTSGVRGQVLHRHRDHDRRRRFRRNRRGSGRAPQGRLRRQPDLPRHAGRRRRLRLPPARRGTCLDAGNRLQAAARRARQPSRRVPRLHPHDQRPERAPADDPRPHGVQARVPTPIPLDEVEPAKEIVKRFATGAMSFGSISREAHTTLAIAMNRIGGKSNTGEGGEESDRYKPLPNGDSERSAIKQVASGRFGVTTEYLVNADDLQIKMAQGAKPGEGGQLAGP